MADGNQKRVRPSLGRGRIKVVAMLFLSIVAYSVIDHYLIGVAEANLRNTGFHRAYDTTPDQMGLTYQSVSIRSGVLRLAGWWIPADPGLPEARVHANATVLLVHGYSASMGKPIRHWAPQLHAAGYSLLAIDLRNHGASDDGTRGYVTYGADEMGDVLAALSWLRSNAQALGVDPARIALYGESMGAASVLNAAATQPDGVKAVVSDSAYASFRFQADLDGAKKHYPAVLIDHVVGDMDLLAPSPPTLSRPDDAIAKLTIPVLLAHCTNDSRIDVASYHELLRRATGPTTSWVQECTTGESGDHHADGWAYVSYNRTVDGFLARALG